MPVPISQMWTVATYVLKQKMAGRKKYPFVLMLEPLFRCNLACAGCGKIQYPAHILKQELSPEECFKAVDECGTPMVSIPGGEPLMHSQIDKIVEGKAGPFYAQQVFDVFCARGRSEGTSRFFGVPRRRLRASD